MGLKTNDLEGTISNKISLDEFEPKSGTTKEIIVIGFYAIDKKPAKDLNTFIQRGYFDVVDSEVSPNPDENGNYLVFVEFKREPNFKKEFPLFLKDIEKVVGKADWEVKPYLSDKYYRLDDPALDRYIITEPDKYKNKSSLEKNMSLESMFDDSYASEVIVENNALLVKGHSGSIYGDIVAVEDVENIESKYLKEDDAIVLDESRETVCLRDILGEKWSVMQFKHFLVLEKENSPAILLRNVQFHYTFV